MKKIWLIIILLISSLFITDLSLAWYVEIPWEDIIQEVSNDINSSWDINTDIQNTSFSLLKIVKIFLQWFLVIFIVYAWARMIIAMWDNEEELSAWKRQLWYWLIAILFINIPWSIYEAFHPTNLWNIDNRLDVNWFINSSNENNIFIDFIGFWTTFWDNIIWFLKILIWAAAILAIILAGIKMLTSRWREDEVKEAKSKIIYSILALLFLGFVEIWKNVAFWWSIKAWINLFWDLANISLFIAWPVAIFFLTLAAYYFIMSAWNEEYIKKARSIVINTILATIILIASYTFLLDLANL